MPTFKIRRMQDAYVEYETEVEAPTLEAAVDSAYLNPGHRWELIDVTRFDAARFVAVDDEGQEIGDYSRGKG